MSDLTGVTRKLVAVFAADVEGYSRLMGADEVGTLKGLTERRAILDRLIGDHRGRIANTAGDSVLAEFGSALDAVKCAVDAQAAIAEANSHLSPDRRVVFRIGIHIGDVMVRAGDLFGDGVNIAARLQALAKPGGVCISGATHDQVRKILPITFADLGAQQVKNIHEPIRVYQAIIQDEASSPSPGHPGDGSRPLAIPDRPSIAVLPFQNLSGDPEQEYFADGIVEDIITALSRFKSLFVIARNSSFTYKNKSAHIPQVGRELGVRYVLEGSVRKAAGRVRITGQLIDATSGMHIWADKLDGTLEDIFELQDSVTEQVVTAMLPRLHTAEIARAQLRRPDNLHAYDSLLQAQALRASRRPDENEKALALLERAIALQPNYALAHALSAACYTDRYIAGYVTDLEAARRKAMHSIERALELDSDDAEILVHAGITIGIFDDSERGMSYSERAVTLNVNSAQGWFAVGAGAMYLGDHERALDCSARALRLSPTGPLRVQALSIIAMSHFLLGQHDESHVWAERAYRENPNYTIAIRALVLSSVATGNLPRARVAFERFGTDLPRHLARMKKMMKRPEDFEKFANAMKVASSSL